MKIAIDTEDSENFDTIIKSLPNGEIEAFGLEWHISEAHLYAPFGASLKLFSKDNIKLGIVEKK